MATIASEGGARELAYTVNDVRDALRHDYFGVVELEPLVRVSLADFRLNDKVNARDLLGVGLIDETWLAKLPLTSRHGSRNCSIRRTGELMERFRMPPGTTA